MREAANIFAVNELKPDYLGLIFYPQSKRYVQENPLGLTAALSGQAKLTGVFVNESEQAVLDKVEQYSLQAVQLHGQETAEYCRTLKSALNVQNGEIEVIKAFGVDETFDFDVLQQYEPVVDFFLFDTKTPEHGGSGVKFNWEVLRNYRLEKPYLLSGGIGLNELEELKKLDDSRLYAVDLNSRFEISPALKDLELVRQAINKIRN